jgi:hypothetical protein
MGVFDMSYGDEDWEEQQRILEEKRQADGLEAPKRQLLARTIYAAIDEIGLTAEDVAIVLDMVLDRVQGNDGGPPREKGENLPVVLVDRLPGHST